MTHLRVSATISIGNAQKLFGTKWDLYATGETNQSVALPVDTPKLGSGLAGQRRHGVGPGALRHRACVSEHVGRRPRAGRTAAVDGGTPTRTGTIDAGLRHHDVPRGACVSTAGLFPNQILSAYGIAPLQAGGLQGQGIRVAILGEAPTPIDDVTAFRNCFGFQGTALTIHGGSGIAPILESSLDAMIALDGRAEARAARPLGQGARRRHDPQGALELLAEPLQATTNGTPLPNVISISYGVCEASVKPYTAARTLFDRQLAATAALGITIVVAAGDSGSSSCAHGVPTSQLDSFDKQQSASWPATSPWVLAVGGTNLTLDSDERDRVLGRVERHEYPHALHADGRRRRRRQRIRDASVVAAGDRRRRRPTGWSPTSPRSPTRAPATRSSAPSGAGLRPSSGQTIAYVGGTSAAAPLVAGMIALWDQQAQKSGLPKPGFVPPLLYSIAKHAPGSFLDITAGTNAVFSGVSCCTAAKGSTWHRASARRSPT